MALITIGSVCSPVPVTVELRDPLKKARLLLREHQVNQLPVMDKGTLKGLITQKDIWLLLGPDFDYSDESDFFVEDAFIPNPLTVDSEDFLGDTLLLMVEKRSASVLVVEGDKLIGIFTETDACRYFGEYLNNVYQQSGI